MSIISTLIKIKIFKELGKAFKACVISGRYVRAHL